MALFRTLRQTHQLRVRRMLQTFVARRQRQGLAAPPLPNAPPAVAADSEATAAAIAAHQAAAAHPEQQRYAADTAVLADMGTDAIHTAAEDTTAATPKKKRGRRRGGRRRARLSANLSIQNITDAVLADEAAQLAGQPSLLLGELLAGLAEDEQATLSTTVAQEAAVRSALRGRRRRRRSRSRDPERDSGDAARLPAPFKVRPTDMVKFLEDGVTGMDEALISPSHPDFQFTTSGRRYALEAHLPASFYAFKKPRGGSESSAAATTSSAPASPRYTATTASQTKAVHSAAARNAFFVAAINETRQSQAKSFGVDGPPPPEDDWASVGHLQRQWAGMTQTEKSMFVPESVRAAAAVAAAPDVEQSASRAVHIASDDDDMCVVPPPASMRAHFIDDGLESLPHFYPLQPRTLAKRLVRTPFQLFADAHIDTARAEMETRERRAKSAKASATRGSSKATDKPAEPSLPDAAAAPQEIEPEAVYSSHAVTRTAVESLAGAWQELRPQERHAYATMAESFHTTSQRYFDDAFEHVRSIHRDPAYAAPAQREARTATAGDGSSAVDIGDAARRAQRRRQRGASPPASPAEDASFVRLPVSPIVRRMAQGRRATSS